MSKYRFAVIVPALALLMGSLPAAAFARDGIEADAQVGVTAPAVSVSATGTAEADDDVRPSGITCTKEAKVCPDGSTVGRQGPSCEFAACPGENSEQAKQDRERARESAKNALELMKEGLPFSLDASTTAVFSLEQLKKSIELRKEELDQEEEDASTTPDVAEAVKNANPVRLAVHTLLASKPLLGGIGPQVSEIAKQMNDSLATTTSAELKIQSRGFLTRLLFGGDKRSAEAISQAVATNQDRIDALTTLLNQASTTPEVKAAIEAQITALGDAQAKLQAAADAEAHAWGLFSWRF